MISRMHYLLAFLMIFCVWVAVEAQTKPSQDKTSNREPESETTKAFFVALNGEWSGSYNLWTRPGTPTQKYDIIAIFKSVAKGNYFLMTYAWERHGEAQEGVFLFGGNGKTARASWGDSFHMVPEPMEGKGELESGGTKLILKGSYSMVDSPAWGWRTEFITPDPELLLMEADNIMPNGVELPAVRAELRRKTKSRKLDSYFEKAWNS